MLVDPDKMWVLMFDLLFVEFFADDSFQVWYQASPTAGPPGLQCAPIALWTVPLYGP